MPINIEQEAVQLHSSLEAEVQSAIGLKTLTEVLSKISFTISRPNDSDFHHISDVLRDYIHEAIKAEVFIDDADSIFGKLSKNTDFRAEKTPEELKVSKYAVAKLKTLLSEGMQKYTALYVHAICTAENPDDIFKIVTAARVGHNADKTQFLVPIFFRLADQDPSKMEELINVLSEDSTYRAFEKIPNFIEGTILNREKSQAYVYIYDEYKDELGEISRQDIKAFYQKYAQAMLDIIRRYIIILTFDEFKCESNNFYIGFGNAKNFIYARAFQKEEYFKRAYEESPEFKKLYDELSQELDQADYKVTEEIWQKMYEAYKILRPYAESNDALFK